MCVSYFSSPIHGKNKPDDFRDEATSARETRTSRKRHECARFSDLLSSKDVNKSGLHLQSWISRAAGKGQQHGTISCLSKAKPPLRRLCIQQGHLVLVPENYRKSAMSYTLQADVPAGRSCLNAGRDLYLCRDLDRGRDLGRDLGRDRRDRWSGTVHPCANRHRGSGFAIHTFCRAPAQSTEESGGYLHPHGRRTATVDCCPPRDSGHGWRRRNWWSSRWLPSDL